MIAGMFYCTLQLALEVLWEIFLVNWRDEGAVAVSRLGRGGICVLSVLQKQEKCAVREQRNADKRDWENVFVGFGTRRHSTTSWEIEYKKTLIGKGRAQHASASRFCTRRRRPPRRQRRRYGPQAQPWLGRAGRACKSRRRVRPRRRRRHALGPSSAHRMSPPPLHYLSNFSGILDLFLSGRLRHRPR